MKRFFQRRTLRSAATEILSIVIGVLLALAVNEWNEDRVHQQRAEQAVTNIIQELKSNIRLMEIIHTNNTAIVNLPNSPEESTSKKENRFIPGLQIQDTAWKTLISTGASAHIEYETLYIISSIYSIQEIYKSFGRQLINTMMSTSALSKALNSDKSNSNIAGNHVFDVLVDDNNKIWFATMPDSLGEGGGLSCYYNTNWTTYDTSNSEITSTMYYK